MSTKNYLCIMRHQPDQACDSKAPSPSEMEKMYAKFNAWKDKFQDNIVDMGGKLGAGKLVTSDNIIDGPFTESKEIIGGFMIVSAETIEMAAEIAQQSPGVFPGSSVEVREINH